MAGSPHRAGDRALRWPLDVPFDQFQRYRVTAEIGHALESALGLDRRPSALDVGGHFVDLYGRPRCPIREFLPSWRAVAVDLPQSPLPGYVRARGDALPFADASFDLVSSVDVLEHVPAPARAALLAELMRVARHAVLVAAPFRSPLVERAEHVLAEFVEQTCGYVQGQLKEHRENGLPDLAATVDRLSLPGWRVEYFAYGNLWRWLFMMLDKHAVAALPGGRAVHRQLDDHYNRTVFELDRELPCYRHFIVATRDAGDQIVAFARERFRGDGARRGVEDISSGTAPFAFELAALHAANQHLQARGEALRRDAQVAEMYEQHAEAQRCLDAKDQHIAELEAVLRAVERSLSYRLARALRRVWPKTGARDGPRGLS